MVIELGILVCSLIVLFVALQMAKVNGQNSERIARLKREAEEVSRAQLIASAVRQSTNDSVCNKLQNTK